MIEILYCTFYLAHIKVECSIAMLDEGATIEQIVELNSHAFTVGIVESEAQAAKCRSEKCRV